MVTALHVEMQHTYNIANSNLHLLKSPLTPFATEATLDSLGGSLPAVAPLQVIAGMTAIFFRGSRWRSLVLALDCP